jgi:hypothetical protein
MQEKARLPPVMAKLDMVEPGGMEGAGTPDDSVHFIAFGKQELGQVRAVLPADAGYQCFFYHTLPLLIGPILDCRGRCGGVAMTTQKRHCGEPAGDEAI